MVQFIKNLARGAGKILKDGFRKEIEINHKKGHWDVVTQYDLAADKFIQGRIKKKYPKHAILSEESGQIGKGSNLWIIDPLDGTRNFSRGIAQFCTIIGYVHGGKLELGAIYDPIRDELFYAQRGRGARLNGKVINVSSAESLDFAHFAADIVIDATSSSLRRKIERMSVKESLWNLSFASAGINLVYTAAGRTDASLMLGGNPWDYAAGCLIAAEAGAKVTDLKGNLYRWTFDELVAANPKVHREILDYLK